MQSKTQHFQLEAQSGWADGEVIWVRNLISPVWENSEVIELKGVTLDITKQKKIAEQRNQNQKLEAIGQLAAGIAHEINTLAQFVGDNIEFFKSSFIDLHVLYKDHEALLALVEESQQFKSDVEKIRAYASQIDAEYLFEEIPNAIEQSLDGIAWVSNIVIALKKLSHPEVCGESANGIKQGDSKYYYGYTK